MVSRLDMSKDFENLEGLQVVINILTKYQYLYTPMNFLAHLYLSGNNAPVMLGNFIGDFVKGRQALSQLSPEVARGVELHRAIDTFTDSQPLVAQSKNRLRPKYRHYAGVIVD